MEDYDYFNESKFVALTEKTADIKNNVISLIIDPFVS